MFKCAFDINESLRHFNGISSAINIPGEEFIFYAIFKYLKLKSLISRVNETGKRKEKKNINNVYV